MGFNRCQRERGKSGPPADKADDGFRRFACVPSLRSSAALRRGRAMRAASGPSQMLISAPPLHLLLTVSDPTPPSRTFC
ncbi:unnamed protein product [Arctogadus glacialis]